MAAPMPQPAFCANVAAEKYKAGGPSPAFPFRIVRGIGDHGPKAKEQREHRPFWQVCSTYRW